MLYLSRDASAHVLVDPSCSGSGMRHEHSSVIEESNVRELVELQTSVLKHALSFPQALRVVYRCSMFQPNEAMQWPLMLVYLQHLLSLRGRERRRRRGGRDYAAQTFLSCAFIAVLRMSRVLRPLTLQVLSSATSDGWSLATALPGWHRRGIGRYTWANKCARVDADEDFCGGFFVALFERNGIEKPRARTRSRKLPVQALQSFYGSSLLGISK